MARGFTLLELLVCVAVVALLAGLLAPSLGAAREAAATGVCLSNQRQLGAGLHLYAGDAGDRAPPGAAEFRANLSRWHGSRGRSTEAFRPEGGALTPYISGDGSESAGASDAVRECPMFAGVLRRLAGTGRGFERSAGGYGYNNAYVGVELSRAGEESWRVADDRVGARLARFRSPGATVAFADAAFPDALAPDALVEYSFAEPRFHPSYGGAHRFDPSIHFRHGGEAAAVVWLDGHAETRTRTASWSSGLYNPAPEVVGLGWFGQDDDNGLFDFEAGGR